MYAFFHNIVCSHSHQVYFAVFAARQYHYTAAQFLFQLVAHGTQSIAVHIFHFRCQHCNAADFYFAVQHFVCCAACHFRFQFFQFFCCFFLFCQQLFQTSQQFVRCGFHQTADFFDFVFLCLIMFQGFFACYSFDSSDTSCYAVFRQDFEGANLCSVFQVSAATKFDAVAAHIYHTYHFAIFFAEQCHCASVSCFVDGHFVCVYIIACEDSVIYQSFHFFDFISSHCCEVCEVETQSFCAYIGTSLFYVSTQNGTQCFVQQVGCAVVSGRSHTQFHVDACASHFAYLYQTFCHFTHVCDFAANNFYAVSYFHNACFCFDHTLVTYLTAAFCVERCSIQEYRYCIASLCCFCNGFVCNQCNDFCVCHIIYIITSESCFQFYGQFVVNGFCCAHVVGFCSCGTCTFFLCFHFCCESVFVDFHAFFCQDFFCQVNRETICVVQTEGFFTGHDFFAGSFHFFHVCFQDFHTFVDGLIEAVFFDGQDFEDVILFFHQFGISFAAASDYGFGQFSQKFAFDAQQFAMTSRTTQQTTQYIATTFVGRQYAVSSHHCYRTDVVCDHTNGNVCFMVFAVFHACFCTNSVTDRFYGIYVENRVNALHDSCHTFQTHTGIYVLHRQFCVCAVFFGVELGQYQIPEFHVSVAVTAYAAGRAVTAVFRTTVIVDFCTRTAGACAVFPEVVFFAQFYDSVPRQTYHIMPDFACFIVFFVNGYVQSVFGDFQYFCYEFPRPGHDFVFEVITEGEVAQHFKECAVTSSFPYVVDITCTDTFLAGCHSLAGRDFLTSKVCFHGCHTGVDQQQAVVVAGHQREAGQTQMVFAFKEFQKFFTNFVYT